MTSGQSVYGIFLGGGNNTATLSGLIETLGEDSIAVYTLGTNNTVTLSGSIETDLGLGIYMVGGNNSVAVSGSIVTSGSRAGIVLLNGQNTVNIAGEVSTAGAQAIVLEDSGNRVELQPGYVILGDVIGGTGSGNTLAFGGAGMEDFDLDRIGSLGPARTQFRSFQTFAVDSGTWNFSGATTEAFTVNAGTLAGTGTFGGLTVASGGIHTPGNSIGTQVVNGPYANHGVLEMEIAENGVSDQVLVNGPVDITGATLRVMALPGAGNWQNIETYRIIDNDGVDAVTGLFTLDNTLAFFDASLDHAGGTGNDIELTMLRNGVQLVDVAATQNQTSAASALDDFGLSSPIYRQILGLSAADARTAYDSASGEIHASGQHVIDATFALFQSGLGGNAPAGNGGQFIPLAYAAQPATNAGLGAIHDLEHSPARHWMWLKPLAGRGNVAADGNAAALDWSAAGLAAGYEGEAQLAGGDAGFGIGAGYLNSAGTVAARASTMSGNGGYLGAYGSWTNGALALSGSLAYGATHVATSRDIVVGAITDTATAGYWSHSIGIDLEAGYGFALGETLTVSPIGTLATGWSGHGGAAETGAGALNATIDPSGAWLLDTGLGLELAHTSQLADGGSLTLKGRALWQHRFGDTTPVQTLTLAGSPTASTVLGPAGDRDRLLVGLGLDYAPSDAITASLSYNGAFSGSEASHGLAAGIKVGF
ncbi:autotransporter outer membrane beta-barrel domain-containing protein [Devosia ginsengisoli]|nr:autotransporter outer membrane beta-barrel domain-containing protein [Devosia ginsengisoli]